MKTPNECADVQSKPVRIKADTHAMLKEYCECMGTKIEFLAEKLIREGLNKLINDVGVQTLSSPSKEEVSNV